MKIYASGEAQSINQPGYFIDAVQERVVGVVDLGSNNGNNIYGWCSVKAVISVNGSLYILDFPTDIRIETWDGVLVIESDGTSMPWWPSTLKTDLDHYDLYLYTLEELESRRV